MCEVLTNYISTKTSIDTLYRNIILTLETVIAMAFCCNLFVITEHLDILLQSVEDINITPFIIYFIYKGQQHQCGCCSCITKDARPEATKLQRHPVLSHINFWSHFPSDVMYGCDIDWLSSESAGQCLPSIITGLLLYLLSPWSPATRSASWLPPPLSINLTSLACKSCDQCDCCVNSL